MRNQVFTQDFIDKLQAKYGQSKNYERPEIFYYATHESYQTFRTEVETLFDEVADNNKDKLLTRLRSDEHIIHFYHELVVGNFLARFSSHLEYDKEIHAHSKITPDWYFRSHNGKEYIVECFTANPDEASKAEIRKLNEFLARLNELEYGLILSVEFTNDSHVFPNQKSAKIIVSQIKQWLASQPNVGNTKEIHNLRFEVTSTESETLAVIGPTLVFSVESSTLKDKIYEKVYTYRNLGIRRFFVPSERPFGAGPSLNEPLIPTLLGELSALRGESAKPTLG